MLNRRKEAQLEIPLPKEQQRDEGLLAWLALRIFPPMQLAHDLKTPSTNGNVDARYHKWRTFICQNSCHSTYHQALDPRPEV